MAPDQREGGGGSSGGGGGGGGIDRRAMLEKQREEFMADYQKQRDDLAKETERRGANAAERFTTRTEGIDEQLKKSTIGLVTLEDFRRTRNELEEGQRRAAAQRAKDDKKREGKKEKKRKAAASGASMLSFQEDGDEDEEGEETASAAKPAADGERISNGTEEPSAAKKPKLLKNPSVDTSFLPDRDREAQESLERERLRQEWLEKQERMKKETIEITYSYWDGTGHRKSVECQKGDDIATFLGKCRQQFPELRGVSVDSLMYIKEDLIIPHHYTFYDFIINKARGKSGPLFHFDVHDDVRMLHDATKERDEAHAGKVVERSWYSRNKHIFPASRWEVYDPDKDYGAYRIGG